MIKFFLFIFCFLLVTIPSSSHIVRFGNCKCYYRSDQEGFQARYQDATSVVSAYVLSRWPQCTSCPDRIDRRNEIMTYELLLYKMFKGSHPGTRFSAQAFTNTDYCGVKLKRNHVYLLNLHSPQGISKTSLFEQDVYLLDACQGHWAWDAVSTKHRQWLEAKKRKEISRRAWNRMRMGTRRRNQNLDRSRLLSRTRKTFLRKNRGV